MVLKWSWPFFPKDLPQKSVIKGFAGQWRTIVRCRARGLASIAGLGRQSGCDRGR